MSDKTEKKQENICGWKIATICFAVLAVVGLGIAAKFIFFSNAKDSESTAFESLEKKINPRGDVSVDYKKKGTTNDGKYYYAFVSSNIEGMDGAWSVDVYFRKTEKGAEWQDYNTGNDSNPRHFPYCKEISGDLEDFIKNYDYLDDDIDEVWVTCWEEGKNY